MSATDNGGPAFPVPALTITPNGDVLYADPGMSLRDYFAGQALAGMIGDIESTSTSEGYAKMSYELSDAMLKARKAEK